jgi:hypothetical protein
VKAVWEVVPPERMLSEIERMALERELIRAINPRDPAGASRLLGFVGRVEDGAPERSLPKLRDLGFGLLEGIEVFAVPNS